MMKTLNSKGSTFVTTLVTVLIFMIVAGSIISRIENSHKASNFNSAKINEMTGITNLKLHIANLATCQKNLKDKSLSSSGELALPSILDASGNALFTSGQALAQNSLYITDIKLRNPTGDPSSVISATPVPAKGFSLPTRIEISFRKEKISFGAKTYTASVEVPVLVDASAKILDCDVTAPAYDLSALCQQVGGTLDAATNICNYPTDCTEKDPKKLASGKCFKDGIASLKTSLEEVKTALATPTPAPTSAPATTAATAAQKQAWTAVEAQLKNCIDGGANVSAALIACRTTQFWNVDLTPTSARIMPPVGDKGAIIYTDPEVAAYIFKMTQDLVMAKFGL